ncbi:MAG: hypothetical protein QOH40_535 [Arthrobacter pascens]|nr:hypothetical protein [Arthrobacter pascens]
MFVRFQSRCQGACWMSRCSRLWRRCGWSLRCLSVPSFPWLGKRNYGGSWWSNTTCSHVGFESLLERDFPMLADHDRDAVGIASRPFAVLWPKGTERARGHVPDFFVRLSDTGLVACEGLGGILRKKLTIKSATARPLRQGKAIPRLPQRGTPPQLGHGARLSGTTERNPPRTRHRSSRRSWQKCSVTASYQCVIRRGATQPAIVPLQSGGALGGAGSGLGYPRLGRGSRVL